MTVKLPLDGSKSQTTLAVRAKALGFSDVYVDLAGFLRGYLNGERFTITDALLDELEAKQAPTLPPVLADFDLLEMAFTAWLQWYESINTERWRGLFCDERRTLAKAQWARFRDELEATAKASGKTTG